METPDANGYVNVQWPSKSIPHGGIFHTRVVEPSAAQQQFLKVLLEEQKLSIAQRQKAPWALRQEDEPKDSRQPTARQLPVVRPRTSRRRSLSAIRESGVFEFEPYQPVKRGEDRELLKARLAKSMEHGDTPEQQPPPPPRLAKPKPKLPTAKETRNELLTQIRERAEWLAEMEDLGHAAPHRDIVHDQIAERLRALDVLGIDSRGSSARSSDSGFSTTGEHVKMGSARSKGSAVKSVQSNRSTSSQGKQKSTKIEQKGRAKLEENVLAYNNVPTLQYSPRRRV